mmetsp:Transcript_15950/g.19851  ORF Transcript_15950/g.19851 Transcript_15950/m.19851 type:complete len:166 (-) Transcript_15950:283-780(-)
MNRQEKVNADMYISEPYGITPSSRKIRLSHRNLLLEKGLQNLLEFTNNPKKSELLKYYDMKYGKHQAQHIFFDSYNVNCSNAKEMNECINHACEEGSNKDSEGVEDRSLRAISAFDDDDNFHEVDGFFVLDTRSTNDGKREGLWKSLFGGKSFLKRSHEVKALFH